FNQRWIACMPVRFDEGFVAAQAVAEEVAVAGLDVVLVRDLLGRVALVVDDRSTSVNGERSRRWTDRLIDMAGAFAAPAGVTLASALLQPEQFLDARDRVIVRPRSDRRGMLALLERGVVGAEWTRLDANPASNRVTLYG